MLDSNYYKVGGSLEYQHPTYVVRQADAQLYQGLINGEFCYVLNSRQMGKSSLRVQMTKKLKAQGVKCAAIDMTRIGSHVTPEEWYGGLVSELLRGFRLSRKINFSNWWRDRSVLSPVQRLSEFIDDVLLIELSENIVIFIDEIDSILKIPFKDDFFAFIRACYNQRVDNPDYQRLTFCLLGVATPSDLIADKQRTPFNIGQAIELTGFTFAEAKSVLIKGLQNHLENPEAVLREVLDWTGGQPFLTQKLCSLIIQEWETMSQGFHPNHSSAANEIEALVQKSIIENWEAWDEPEHLRTIRDRILVNEQRAGRLLGLYQHILQQGQIPTDESPEQVELRLTGLVVRQPGYLKVYNPIYAGIFNHRWVDQELANLRPYSQAIRAWEVSNRQDQSRLLRGSALQEALAWATNKSLGVTDYAFLTESQQQELEAERQAKQILGLAKQKAEQLLAEAKEGTRLERAGVSALQLFAAGGREIEALLAAMQAGQALLKRVQEGRSLPDYPATSPIFALQQILSQIRECNQFSGHRGGIISISFSPDGRLLATASTNGTARLWQVSGKTIATCKRHQGKVSHICFSPDGQFLATASTDGITKLWDLAGTNIATCEGQASIWNVCFSPDGKQLATASDDGTVQLWDLSGNPLTQFSEFPGGAYSVSFSPDGEYLAVAAGDGSASLWNLRYGYQSVEFKGHQSRVNSICFSPNGEYLVTTSNDYTAKLWNIWGYPIAEFKGHQSRVNSASFHPNGEFLVTASNDSTVRFWDLSGNKIGELQGDKGGVRQVSFSPNGQQFATASGDPIARLWTLSAHQIVEFKGHQDWVRGVCFSPDGQYLATAAADRTAKLWDLSGNLIVEFKGHQDWVRDVCFSPDGRYIATASGSNVRLWDVSGNLIVKFYGHRYTVVSVQFSPDGQYLATAGADYTAKLWNLSGKLISTWRNHRGWVRGVCFSPNGKYLGTASDDRSLNIWDISGKLVAELRGHRSPVRGVSFSPDGRFIASASGDHTARLWNLAGDLITEFVGHRGWVLSVCFSPNGDYIATGSGDGTAKLWDYQGNLLAQFNQSPSKITRVSFSPDGKRLATAASDGVARLWQVEGLEELLCRGCNWLKEYWVTHPEELDKLDICQQQHFQ